MAHQDPPQRGGGGIAPRLSRDWPLVAAAGTAVLSFFMLFAPWVSDTYTTVDAFGEGMQAAGPALIIVVVLAFLGLVGAAFARDDRKFAVIALIPASVLLVLYIVKVADVSDLVDLNNQLTQTTASTGAGLWIGLLAAIATAAFTVVAAVQRDRPRTQDEAEWHVGAKPPVNAPPPPPYDPPKPPAT
ncbi:hypothetical protein [Streptomyces sp. CB01881]|uniref:DUF7937 domain-containing protein n=1 Tax=Streptomyces sp. CB01881 TaxID=2078691 RepID=UPI000CDC708A|nr:hypothetical protein [Streptomyces sp. CB01881]AUY52206.1 hypothetical protein C2142_28435 [Streptomyces sp. CB01881]TYC71633.1 hypothetical protein EH183_28430 [Streptomyces sp. CB01881]